MSAKPSLLVVLSFVLGFLTTPGWAAPGIVLVERVTANGAARTTQIHMTADKMRAEVQSPDGQLQVVIFDGSAQVMYVIVPERKTYMEMTKADVDRVAAQMPAMMAQARQMLEKLPPEQRAQLEAQLEKITGSRAIPGSPGYLESMKPEFRKGGTDRVGAWTCDVYETLMNGKKVGDMCTVSFQALGFTSADFAMSQRMATFFRALVPQGADGLFQVGTPGGQGFEGVPVRRSVHMFGTQTVSELQSATRQNIADDVFVPPQGFQKSSMPAMPGGPGLPTGAPPARRQ